MTTIRSAWIWLAVILLILIWLPLLMAVRLFDRDPVRYRTGRWFRRLGVAMTRANPAWKLVISGVQVENPRRPYVVVSNHQSHADIPLISHLPWEMKWIAKKELFSVPVVGWMMRLAGDIPVDRSDRRSGARMLLQANRYLQARCSVMFFPEGTRSPDGKVHQFNDGAFHLAVRAGVPILPLAVEGSRGCLPKKSWRFGEGQRVLLSVLQPVETGGLTAEDVPSLRDEVRARIIGQIARWRGIPPSNVDGSPTPAGPSDASGNDPIRPPENTKPDP